MPDALPFFFRHNKLARNFNATPEQQELISKILEVLAKPNFPMLENLEEISIVLFFLPKTTVPQEEVAAHLGVDMETIQNWIISMTDPTPQQADALVAFLINRLTALKEPASSNA